MSDKWEYSLLPVAPNVDEQKTQEMLTEKGNDGWEIAGNYIHAASGCVVFVFKRPGAHVK